MKVILSTSRQKEHLQFEVTLNDVMKLGRTGGEGLAVTFPSEWRVVSRQHCQIRRNADGLFIEDLGSANGTFVNGKPISSRQQLQSGDSFQLGSGEECISCNLYFNVEGSNVKKRGRPTSFGGHTLVSQLENKEELIIGRSAECDVVLNGDNKVSRRHARVFKRKERYFIEDLQSTNGTFVGDRRISGTTELVLEDSIFIGLHTLTLQREATNLSDKAVVSAHGVTKVWANGNRGLHSTSLDVRRAEMVAIMGPSGSGKSTLLKILNGEISSTEGRLKIFGLDFEKHKAFLGTQIGYVPQDDIIHPELTVRQTLYYAARIRLPEGQPMEKIDERIQLVLKMVSLEDPKLRETKVRELSGGQRKRVSIAVELLNDPKLLFLDEPTSPLDPETIDEFLKCLRGLKDNGTTVLIVTHKPEDLHYMDRVIFIGSGGYHAYDGPPKTIAQHFKVDSIIGVYALLSKPSTAEQWHLEETGDQTKQPSTPTKASREQKSQTSQLYWQVSRYIKVKLGNPANIKIILLQPIIIALLVIVTFEAFRSDVVVDPFERSKFEIAETGLIFLVCLAAVWFGVSLSAKEIVEEKAIYLRERKMRLTPIVYLLSKQIVLGGLLFVQLAIFMGMLLMKYGDDMVFPMETTAFLMILGGASVLYGLALSAFSNSSESVMSILPIALMPQIILSGIVSPVKSDLMEILSYFTFGRWGTEGLTRIQDTAKQDMGVQMIEDQLYYISSDSWLASLDMNLAAIVVLGTLFFVAVLGRLYTFDKTP